MKTIVLGIIALILSACDSGVQWSEGVYSVYWIDTSENRQLGFVLDNGSAIGRIEGEIIAVGSNTKYVVAKRYNHTLKEVQYYFIEKEKDHKFLNGNEIVEGPFNVQVFTSKTKELSLPKFSKEFG